MAPCARDLGTAPGAARTTSSNVAVAAVVCFFLREKQRERVGKQRMERKIRSSK